MVRNLGRLIQVKRFAASKTKMNRLKAMPQIVAIVRSMHMMDIVMIALGLAFFALSVGYTVACDRL